MAKPDKSFKEVFAVSNDMIDYYRSKYRSELIEKWNEHLKRLQGNNFIRRNRLFARSRVDLLAHYLEQIAADRQAVEAIDDA